MFRYLSTQRNSASIIATTKTIHGKPQSDHYENNSLIDVPYCGYGHILKLQILLKRYEIKPEKEHGCPSFRAALLTGLYPVTTGIYPGVFWPSSIGGLSPNHSTVAKHLRQAGYRTSHIGKWHLGVGSNGTYLPTNHGFDEYYGIPYSHDMCPCQICFPLGEPCFGRCNNDDVSCPLFLNTTIVEQPTSLPDLTRKYTNKAIQQIKQFSKSGDPFFMYLAYHETHHPQFAGMSIKDLPLDMI